MLNPSDKYHQVAQQFVNKGYSGHRALLFVMNQTMLDYKAFGFDIDEITLNKIQERPQTFANLVSQLRCFVTTTEGQ